MSLVAAPASRSSSHREAPNIMLDPTADNTDTYAFVSPDAPDALTLVGDWIPGQNPANGPNFFRFDDRAFYYLNVENTGDGKTDLRYLFKFKTKLRNPSSFLYAKPPVNSFNDATLNSVQTYDVSRETFRNGRRTGSKVLARNLSVPPSNVGEKTMPDYAKLAAEGNHALPGGGKVFAGQRDDPFFVDLGDVFDSVHFRFITGTAGGGKDDFAGTSTSAIVLQVPKSEVTSDRKGVSSPDASNAVVGVWASTERQSLQVTNARFNDTRLTRSARVKKGKKGRRRVIRRANPQVQVSRLGNPLFNEVIVPLGKKDMYNRTAPENDMKNFGRNVLNPELAAVANALFPGIVSAPTTNRTDLVQVLLTGIPGLNQIKKNPVGSDTLKINLGIPPAMTPSRFGVIGGDTAGFPNGRRLADDIVDIDEQVVAGFLKGNKKPLGDGVDVNDKPFATTFPYLAAPTSGFDSQPSNRVEPQHVPDLPGGGLGPTLGRKAKGR